MNKDAVAAQLINDEDLRLKPYDDATGKELKPGDIVRGKITIGIGRNITDKGISKSIAMLMLDEDIAGAEADLDRCLPWWRVMTERRQTVILSMCFNMGIGNSTKGLLSFRNALTAMQKGDYKTAARGLRDSAWYKQVGQRAERLAKMMEEG